MITEKSTGASEDMGYTGTRETSVHNLTTTPALSEARGFINCPDCEGSGLIHESHVNTCGICQGTGHTDQPCSTCGASGYIEEQVPCGACGGSGMGFDPDGNPTMPCPACNGSGTFTEQRQCDTCQGSGAIQVPCESCAGTGNIETTNDRTCETCNGTGKIPKEPEYRAERLYKESSLQESKTVTTNGTVYPDTGYEALKKVTVNVPNQTEEKTVNITKNGTSIYEPTSPNIGIKKLTVSTNVPSQTPNLQDKTVNITANGTTAIIPDSGYDGLSRVVLNTQVGGTNKISVALSSDNSKVVFSLLDNVSPLNSYFYEIIKLRYTGTDENYDSWSNTFLYWLHFDNYNSKRNWQLGTMEQSWFGTEVNKLFFANNNQTTISFSINVTDLITDNVTVDGVYLETVVYVF